MEKIYIPRRKWPNFIPRTKKCIKKNELLDLYDSYLNNNVNDNNNHKKKINFLVDEDDEEDLNNFRTVLMEI